MPTKKTTVGKPDAKKPTALPPAAAKATRRPTAKDMKAAAQKLPYPAKQADMKLQPASDLANYRAAGKLQDKIALITGADSGIGRAVAVAFAKEGAHVAIVFNTNVADAEKTKQMVEKENRKCLLLQLDVRDPEQCKHDVRRTSAELGGLNILVNNAAFQMSQPKFEDISEEQIRRTFDTNILGYIWMAQATIPHLKKDDCIINTGSIVGITGIPILVDYACSKAGIHALISGCCAQRARMRSSTLRALRKKSIIGSSLDMSARARISNCERSRSMRSLFSSAIKQLRIFFHFDFEGRFWRFGFFADMRPVAVSHCANVQWIFPVTGFRCVSIQGFRYVLRTRVTMRSSRTSAAT